MPQQVLEGTWEEVAAHAEELTGRRVKVIVEPEEIDLPAQPNIGPPNLGPPNEPALRMLQELEERQQGRRYTADDCVALLRYGRSGPMYGMHFVDDSWKQPEDEPRTEQ